MAGNEPSRDVGHEHRKATQHRIDPAIKRRRGHESSLRGVVPCHGRHYRSALASNSSRTRRFFILWKMLGKRRGGLAIPVECFALIPTSMSLNRCHSGRSEAETRNPEAACVGV